MSLYKLRKGIRNAGVVRSSDAGPVCYDNCHWVLWRIRGRRVTRVATIMKQLSGYCNESPSAAVAGLGKSCLQRSRSEPRIALGLYRQQSFSTKLAYSVSRYNTYLSLRSQRQLS